jgi:hypothetical protein
MSEIFDIIKNINTKGTRLDFDNIKSGVYTPYVVNKAFAMSNAENLFIIDEINQYPSMSAQMHYDYLYYSTNKFNGYNKWIKEDTNKYIKYLCKHFSCSSEKAKEFYKLCTQQDLEELEKRYSNDDDKGRDKNI